LHALNDHVVQLAAQAKVTKGRKLCVDATCVETTIHHPTDSGLLVDSVQVLSRLVQRAKPLLYEQMSKVGALCRSLLRSARRVAQSLHRLRRRKSELKEEVKKDHYRRLITTTEHMVHQAKQMIAALAHQND
jgi:IS5 family transposase